MQYLFILLACIQLSSQLPHPGLFSSLVPREHISSPYTSKLLRRSSSTSQRLGKRQATTSGSAQITDNEGIKYLIPISFGSQTFLSEIDTGSSDTWLMQTGYQCYQTYDTSSDSFTGPESESNCNFSPTYTPDADFEIISEIFQFGCYGQSGESSLRCVEGPLGYTSVTIAGLTVPQQIVGAPNQSSEPSPGLPEDSGIIGLAFPPLTSARNASTGELVHYNSLMETFFVDTFDPPLAQYFAIALSRDNAGSGSGGTFTIGGVPDLTDPSINVSSTSYTSAAFQFVASQSTTKYSFYSFLVDSFVLGTSSDGAGTQVILDSGADVIQVPNTIAQAVNSVWSPPMDSGGTLACDARLTEPFGITIGGATYYVDSADLLFSNGDGTCSSLLAAGEEGEYLVGDPFLRNVLAVYDWGGEVMSFYARMYYES